MPGRSIGRTTKNISSPVTTTMTANSAMRIMSPLSRLKPAAVPWASAGRSKRTLTTCSWSPRFSSKPTAARTRASMRCISSAERAWYWPGLPPVPGGVIPSTATDTDSFFSWPGSTTVVFTDLEIS